MKSSRSDINSWLNTKFDNHENGIFLDNSDLESFEPIQDFLETKEQTVKTPVIYYQAIADENLEEFISTLEDELRSKLGCYRSQSCPTTAEAIAAAGLKTIIIDRSHLCAGEMINGLWKWLAEYQVGLILVVSQAKIQESPILSHPVISHWERFTASGNLVDLSCA